MKKYLISLLSAMIVILSVVSTSFAATSDFSDISNSFAKDAIIQLQNEGILNGIDADHFDPQGDLTRAQYVTILVKALKLPIDLNAVSSFSDVDGWAVPYIEAAYKAGIISGVGNGKFAPTNTVTREQSAVIMVRALRTQGAIDESADLTFTDADSISDWAKNDVALALKYGLIKGNPDGSFNPQGNANREQAAVMGSNFLNSVVVVSHNTPTPTPKATSDSTTTPTTPEQTKSPTPTATPTPTPAPTIAPPTDNSGNNGSGGKPRPTPADTTAPVITLVGNMTEIVTNGDVYIDAGVMITDNKDTDLEAIVMYTKDGEDVVSIDTSLEGNYIVHYNVSDAAGNEAVEVTRNVTITTREVDGTGLLNDLQLYLLNDNQTDVSDGDIGTVYEFNVNFGTGIDGVTKDNIKSATAYFYVGNELVGTKSTTDSFSLTLKDYEGLSGTVSTTKPVNNNESWLTSYNSDENPTRVVLKVIADNHTTYVVSANTTANPVPVEELDGTGFLNNASLYLLNNTINEGDGDPGTVYEFNINYGDGIVGVSKDDITAASAYFYVGGQLVGTKTATDDFAATLKDNIGLSGTVSTTMPENNNEWWNTSYNSTEGPDSVVIKITAKGKIYVVTASVVETQ